MPARFRRKRRAPASPGPRSQTPETPIAAPRPQPKPVPRHTPSSISSLTRPRFHHLLICHWVVRPSFAIRISSWRASFRFAHVDKVVHPPVPGSQFLELVLITRLMIDERNRVDAHLLLGIQL